MTPLKPIIDAYDALVDWKPPGCLYHYTTFDALERIVTSHIFRATHRSYLNDKTDLSHGLNACMEFVRRWTDGRSGSEQKIGQEVLRNLEEKACGNPSSPFSFSASFTEEGDGAAQWQVYGRYGRGVAICLDFECLRHSLQEAKFSDPEDGRITGCHFFLSKVEYDKEIQQGQVVRLLDVAVGCWPRACEFYPVSPEEKVAHYVSNILNLPSHKTFKHRGHMYDREWKATPNVSSQEFVRFHATRSVMRPFIEMSFDPSCIRYILVGSSVAEPFEDVKRTLALFLQKHNLTNVEIKQSEILLAPPDE